MENFELCIGKEKHVHIENNFNLISSPSPKELLCVHGLGMYGGHFYRLAESLTGEHMVTHVFDLPAFGKSRKSFSDSDESLSKNWIYSLSEVWKSVHSLERNNVKKEREIFLLGHSLGGIMTAAALKRLKPKPAGIILCCPAFASHKKSYPFLSFVLPTLKKIFTEPKRKIQLPFPKEFLSLVSSPESFMDEKELTKEVEAKLFLDILKVQLEAWLSFWSFKDIPLLLLQGDKDETCVPSAAKMFLNLCPSNNKTLITYENFGHDLFVISESDQIHKSIIDWMKKTGT